MIFYCLLRSLLVRSESKNHETAGLYHVQSSALTVDDQHSMPELHRHCTSLSSSCNMCEMPVSSSCICNKGCSPNALLRMSHFRQQSTGYCLTSQALMLEAPSVPHWKDSSLPWTCCTHAPSCPMTSCQTTFKPICLPWPLTLTCVQRLVWIANDHSLRDAPCNTLYRTRWLSLPLTEVAWSARQLVWQAGARAWFRMMPLCATFLSPSKLCMIVVVQPRRVQAVS